MMSRLLFRHQSVLQLSLAVIGSVFGLVILLSSLQTYFDFKNLLTSKTDLINPQFIIINKKVSLLNTISFSHSSFSNEEISELEKVPTVKKVGAFTSNLFSAQAFIDKKSSLDIPGFYTELFFESVDDDFIDVKSDEWRWNSGSDFVPMIVPADYLNLYNFGFAPSQNLPQVSKKTAQMATFQIKIHNRDTMAIVNARIVGFSDRINSFLVPKRFLEEANATFGNGKQKDPSRLIVVSEDPSNPQLMKFLDEKGYETSAENLRNSKLNLVLRIIMRILVAIGSMIILLSLLGFIQYSQLMISKSKYEIRTLIQLGYYYTSIAKKYVVFYVMMFLGIMLISFGVIYFLKLQFNRYMEQNGFEVENGISTDVIIAAVLIFCFLLIANGISIYRNIISLARPNN
jgi:hypothetical protein